MLDIEVAVDRDPSVVRKNIAEMAEKLAEEYGKNPIFYVTSETYQAYIAGYFSEYQIWVRSVFTPPWFYDREWQFWQFSNRSHVNGIEGYVDENVFFSSKEKLENL